MLARSSSRPSVRPLLPSMQIMCDQLLGRCQLNSDTGSVDGFDSFLSVSIGFDCKLSSNEDKRLDHKKLPFVLVDRSEVERAVHIREDTSLLGVRNTDSCILNRFAAIDIDDLSQGSGFLLDWHRDASAQDRKQGDNR